MAELTDVLGLAEDLPDIVGVEEDLLGVLTAGGPSPVTARCPRSKERQRRRFVSVVSMQFVTKSVLNSGGGPAGRAVGILGVANRPRERRSRRRVRQGQPYRCHYRQQVEEMASTGLAVANAGRCQVC